MSQRTIDTSYEPFSREPEYIEGNRPFVAELPLANARRVLDLACGCGTISELMLGHQPDMLLCGLDLSRESLGMGLQDFLASGLDRAEGLGLTGSMHGGRPRLALVEGTADTLPFADDWADLVTMCHSIHNLPDVDRLLREIRRVLAPGGVFAFNSTFYAGSQPPETDGFYQEWWKGAMRYIMDLDAELKRQGKPGIKRQRGKGGKAFSYRWLNPAEWREALERNGLKVRTEYERTIMMSQSNHELIGSYSGMARQMMSGYDVELASEALLKAVGPAFQQYGKERMPRLWLEMTATVDK